MVMVKKSSKTLKTRLTTLREKEAEPVPLTIWIVACGGGQITCKPRLAAGAVRISTGPWVPPELFARTIPIGSDLEDSICR
jgi:hypothetical protein